MVFVLIAVGFIGFKLLTEKGPEYVTAKVERGSLKRTVSITGSVISDISTDLHFEVGGRLANINYSEGKEVIRGDIIAELLANDEKLQVEEAMAVLQAAKANLALKKAGASLEDIKVAETNVKSAEIALKIAETNFNNIKESGEENSRKKELELQNTEVSEIAALKDLENSKISLDNVINENAQNVQDSYDALKTEMQKNLLKVYQYLLDADEILGVDDEDINDSFESSLGILKSTTLEAAQQAYGDAKNDYQAVNTRYNELDGDNSLEIIKSVASDLEWALYSLDNVLLKTRILLNNSVVSSKLTETMLSTFKSAIDTDRIGGNTELTSLQTKKQALISAELNEKAKTDAAQASYDTNKSNYDKALKNKEIAEHNLAAAKTDEKNNVANAALEIEAKTKALETAKASFNLKKAPPRSVDIASLEAQVIQAEAAFSLAEKNLEKTKLRAPSDGVIVNLVGEVGENISVSQNFATIISPQLIIEADVSETDIDKIDLGQFAEITFDAFGEEEKFSGEIFFINPAETKIQDVIYYKIKVSMEERQGKSIRSGMTANLDILTAQNDNILYIPGRAIIEKNGEKIARVLSKGELKEVKVVTGLRGDGALVEIVDGLSEGEVVVISVK